jgi:ribosomal protein L29
MKKNDLKAALTLDTSALEKRVAELSSQLTSAYLAKSARKLNNVSLIKTLRRDIAQLKTILSQRTKTLTPDLAPASAPAPVSQEETEN